MIQIEDLEEAAKQYATEVDFAGNATIVGNEAGAFKAGANWQKEQFEKNRLAACDKQTEEEAQIEMDFAISIIEKEHRQPTFDDAIKYGMKLQKEQMMKNAIEGETYSAYIGNGKYEQAIIVSFGDILKEKPKVKKVKLIIVKEE